MDQIIVKRGGHRRRIPASRLSKFKRLGYEVVEEEKKVNLDEMSREELYELAQKKDIEGRSEMDKAELLKALKEVL